MDYHHKQTGWTLIALSAIIGAFAIIGYVAGGSLDSLGLFAVILTIVVLLLFASLTVEVEAGNLLVLFGPGLVRRSIALQDIVDVRTVTHLRIYGWGIRWWPGRFWLWNVGGIHAVELTLKGGRHFRIGTDEPEALVRAIQNGKELIT